MKLNVPYYVSTNNKHNRCLQVFVELWNKFTNNHELTVLGYDLPDFKLTDNCNFISMGKQGPVEEWSTDLRNYFIENAPEYFIYSTEDVFFYKDLNIEYTNYLIDIAKLNKNFGKLQLTMTVEGDITKDPCYNLAHLKTSKYEDAEFDMYQLVNSDYSVNCQPSIWNKEFLMKYLIPGHSPWGFEIQCANAARNDDKWVSILLAKQYPVFKVEGFGGGFNLSEQWTNKDAWINHIDNAELVNKIQTWHK